ncbi:MAG: hypothetical protein IH855_13600 [Bacteroidetes bacterium]|nr:hypothetical protein [Bacteroidota bacterium]
MKFLFLTLIVVGTLVLFNPDKKNFNSFVAERAQTGITDNARETSSGGLLGGGSGTLTSELTRASFERSNYFILSTYVADLNGAEHDGGEWKFLGVGGQFFELERPRVLGG